MRITCNCVKILTLFILFALLGSSASAFVPIVPYKNYSLPDPSRRGQATGTLPENGNLSEGERTFLAKDQGSFPLLMGYSEPYIRHYIQNNGPVETSFKLYPPVFYHYENKRLQNLHILEVEYAQGIPEGFYTKEQNPPHNRALAAYVFENGFSVGVIFWENISYHAPQLIPEYTQIKSLPKDKSKLKQYLPHYPVKRLELYQAPRQDQWTEKYGLLEVRLHRDELEKYYGMTPETLVFQAFYLSKLENILQDYIRQNLAYNLTHLGHFPMPSGLEPLNQRTPLRHAP